MPHKKKNYAIVYLSETPVFSFLMSCLFNPLFQSDSLRLFMQESPAPLQTSFQFEGWRGIKREEGRGRRGEHRRTMHFRKPWRIRTESYGDSGWLRKRKIERKRGSVCIIKKRIRGEPVKNRFFNMRLNREIEKSKMRMLGKDKI